MSAYQIVMPVSALFGVPFIRQNMVRLIWDGRDVTPDVDHSANRRACVLANDYNARIAARYNGSVTPPYYHYDALSGKALEVRQ